MSVCENACLHCWRSILVSDGEADNIFWRSARSESFLTFYLSWLVECVCVCVCVCLCVCVSVCVCVDLPLAQT